MQRITVPFQIKAVEGEERNLIRGYASVFGNVDLGGDIVHQGAFKKTLKERLKAGKIKFFFNHNLLGGTLVDAREDEHGLWTESRISEAPSVQDQMILAREGHLNGMSFAFDTVKFDFEELPDGRMIRNLRELKLWEVSAVPFGMNEEAAVIEAKALEDRVARLEERVDGIKSVVAFQDLPLADRARAWDASAADKRVRAWAGVEDAPNAKYRRAFVWYDGEAADQFGSYKLQIGDVTDGALTAVPRGVFAAAAVMQGARGGVNIPDSDVSGVKAHLDKYYAKMRREFEDEDIVAPWKGLSPAAPNDPGTGKSATDQPNPNEPGEPLGDFEMMRRVALSDAVELELLEMEVRSYG